MSDDALPKWVTDRYVVLDRVGDGMYTVVDRARDRVRNQPYAIKVLQPEHRKVPRIRDRFVTEAKAMSRLVHPNIVRILDVGGALSEEPAIVMEYVPGGDLRNAVPKGGLEMVKGLRLALFTLAGLAEAHKNGITHRGVCPEAILLGNDGKPKVSDFGVARLEQHTKLMATMTVESLGSLFYMSPEQRLKAREADPRSDVYAMGGLVYFLLLGRDPPDLSMAHEAPALVAKLPDVVRPIVLKSVTYNADDRYRDATEMGRALKGLFTG